MRLKVCGINDADNLNELLKINPGYVGFIFYSKSKRCIKDKSITNLVKYPTKSVGVFVNEQLDIVLAIAANNRIGTIQLHGEESPEYCSELKECGLEVIKVFNVDEYFDFKRTSAFSKSVNYFLFDSSGNERGGNGVKFNWELLTSYDQPIPFFISGGIGMADVDELKKLSHPQLYAVDINSQFELSPGLKYITAVAQFNKNLNDL